MKTVWRVTNFLLSICDNFETGEIGLFIKVLLKTTVVFFSTSIYFIVFF